MAIIESTTGTALQIDSSTNAALVQRVCKGDHFSMSGMTGIIAAGLVAGSALMVLRFSPTATKKAYIHNITAQITTLTAFTTAVTAGRRLALWRGSGANATGGALIDPAVKLDQTSPDSFFDASLGGDTRIATTAALTATGITWDTNPLEQLSMTHIGAAGGHLQGAAFSDSCPLVLGPGEILAIRSPIAMDAGGTFQICVNLDWVEY